MIKNVLTIWVIAIIFLITLTLFYVVAEEIRHPKNIKELVDASFRSYREFIEWLNYTGIASKLRINLSNVKDIALKSPVVLDEIYNNAVLSMFIGAIQLKQLKMFTHSTDYIDQRDIVELLKVVALKLNISKVDPMCRDLFSKLFINMIQPRFCNYTLTDLDHLTWYIMKLGSILPTDRLTSILGKVYTIKMAMRVKAINKDMLNSLLNELLYRESIVVYLILNDVVTTSRIIVVPPSQATYSMEIAKGMPLYNKSSSRVLTFEDLEKVLSMLSRILELSEKHGISLTSDDVLNIINYILSLDIEEAIAIIKSIDESSLRNIRQSQTYDSRNNLVTTSPEVNKEEGFPSYTIPMTLPDEFYDYYREFEEYMGGSMDTYGGDKRGSDKNVEGEINLVDVEAFIAKVITSGSLAVVVDKVNIPVALIPSLGTGDNLLSITTYPRRPFRESQVSGRSSSSALWLYLILLFATSAGIAIIFKPHFVLRVLMRMSRIFRGDTEDIHDIRNNSIFELFWVLMYKLALVFGVQITGSDTHREAYTKVVSKHVDKDFRRRLEDITKGYEVLRFSDKPYVDKDRWTKSVASMLNEYD
ncbi:MAG: hypothetical protein QXL96_09415 [Ignisphaera sp.]